jgi:hypothetical protein
MPCSRSRSLWRKLRRLRSGRNMKRIAALACIGMSLSVAAVMAGPVKHAGARPLATTAAEVIERNVAARGGLEAWRKVDTMAWLGHLDHASKDGQRVPFAMQLKRPNLTRFEVKEQSNDFTRIFDGSHGWKVRPAADGRPETKSFAPEEVNFSRAEFVIDGPLMDYRAKGVTADLDGIDMIEGRKAYRLSLVLPSGAQRKVWIDTETNLDIRCDRPATNPLKPGAPVSVYYRDYATVDGIKVPRSIETGVGTEPADKLVIERVLVNPKLDEGTFLPPTVPMRRGGHVRIPAN